MFQILKSMLQIVLSLVSALSLRFDPVYLSPLLECLLAICDIILLSNYTDLAALTLITVIHCKN